jgi:ectoine hydroxylase-related dioxygenase (phytanoyl-CoA dioxygenase family)
MKEDLLVSQLDCYRANSYVILPDLLSPEQVAELNEAMDRDRRQHPYFWGALNSRNGSSNLLLTEPVFEPVVRHPQVLPLVEALMGGPICFEELSVQITPPSQESRPTAWHRDRGHWLEHPLHLDYPQIIYYLTDVEPGCHHFTLSPEPADGEVLETAAQVARCGSLPFYGKAGSAILFNSATLHGLTLAATQRERRILQIYYGHEGRKPLAEVTLMPPRLWREHPNPEIRRFYGKLNNYTRDMLRWLCAGE